jgi:hypothetical protein
MYFNVGDRVLTNKGDICTIIVIHRLLNRYYIRYIEKLNVQGTNVDSWVSYLDIKIDKGYYRDLKIEQILI